MQKVRVIVNPGSGKGEAGKYAQMLKETLEMQWQAEVEIVETKGPGDAKLLAGRAYQEGFDTVICLGGDGTVNETVSGIMGQESKVDFGFIPLGTVNDLGRALQIPLNPEEAIAQFPHYIQQKLDIGKVNDRFFVNTIAIGQIPETVMETSSDEKNAYGKLAYIKDGIKAAFNPHPYALVIEDSQGRPSIVDTTLLIIGMTKSVGGFEQMNQEAKVNDGLMYLSAVKGKHLGDIVAGLAEGKLFGQESDKLLTLSDHRFHIKETSGQEVICNMDGDEGPKLPLEIEVLREALQVYGPLLD